jgi:UDP-2,3-diacylglucosamine pyrophosphatase LpxH
VARGGRRAEFLLDFLESTQCDVLYLIGDIVDLWALKRSFYWPSSHQAVLRRIIAKAAEGTRVVYVPGNHDMLVRDIAARQFLDIEVATEAVHTTADGRRLLLIHGDQFDHVVLCSRLNRWVGNASYSLLLALNQLANGVRRRLRLPYWSLAYYVKNRVSNARAAIETFERAAVHEARRRGFDGVVCGHIHQPELRVIDDLLYCNDGDWVESCTALVEHRSGRLELVHWGDLQQPLKCEHAASVGGDFQLLQLPRLSAR